MTLQHVSLLKPSLKSDVTDAYLSLAFETLRSGQAKGQVCSTCFTIISMVLRDVIQFVLFAELE